MAVIIKFNGEVLGEVFMQNEAERLSFNTEHSNDNLVAIPSK